MVFRDTWEKVVEGSKTQTRRPVKAGDRLLSVGVYEEGGVLVGVRTFVENGEGRLRWEVGRTYAVQPGRGKKQVGRILLTGIWREWLRDITPGDVIAEGFGVWEEGEETARADVAGFVDTWDGLYGPGMRWEDNPGVWVLEFELVQYRLK